MSTFAILFVRDVARLAHFYAQAFGFERAYRWPPEGDQLEYVYLKREDSGLGVAHSDDERRGGFELCLYVDDVDGTAAQLRELGAREVSAPADQPWGERVAFFEDPDGHRLHVTASAK
jgi:lactoylglutathione lyase